MAESMLSSDNTHAFSIWFKTSFSLLLLDVHDTMMMAMVSAKRIFSAWCIAL